MAKGEVCKTSMHRFESGRRLSRADARSRCECPPGGRRRRLPLADERAAAPLPGAPPFEAALARRLAAAGCR